MKVPSSSSASLSLRALNITPSGVPERKETHGSPGLGFSAGFLDITLKQTLGVDVTQTFKESPYTVGLLTGTRDAKHWENSP